MTITLNNSSDSNEKHKLFKLLAYHCKPSNGQFIVLPVQDNFSEIPEKYEP